MGCRGLRRYMNDILPSTHWSSDDMKPALTNILRRLDKTFSKIHKKASIRRNTDWAAASDLLKGVYETLVKYSYIANFQYLKALLTTCQVLILILFHLLFNSNITLYLHFKLLLIFYI